MLSSLYLSDTDDKTDDDETASCLFNANIIQTLQADIDKLKGDFLAQKVQAGKHDFKQSVESVFNWEASLRQAVDASLAELEEYLEEKSGEGHCRLFPEERSKTHLQT